MQLNLGDMNNDKEIRYCAAVMLDPRKAEQCKERFVQALKDHGIHDLDNGNIVIEADWPLGYLTIIEYAGSRHSVRLLQDGPHIGMSCRPLTKHSLEIWDEEAYDAMHKTGITRSAVCNELQ